MRGRSLWPTYFRFGVRFRIPRPKETPCPPSLPGRQPAGVSIPPPAGGSGEAAPSIAILSEITEHRRATRATPKKGAVRILKGAPMSRVSQRSSLLLCLVLLFALAVRLNAAPAPPSASAFLASLAGEPSCQARSAASSVPGVPQNPAPVYRTIFQDCGFACSEPACSGARNGDICFDDFGQQGTCVANNTFCREIRRSPCTCLVF
jgi:hypothetical protein